MAALFMWADANEVIQKCRKPRDTMTQAAVNNLHLLRTSCHSNCISFSLPQSADNPWKD